MRELVRRTIKKYRRIQTRTENQIRTLIRLSDVHGDSGGICITLGNDSMSDSKQKSSYEHGSDFERLRSYDRLKLRIEGNDY